MLGDRVVDDLLEALAPGIERADVGVGGQRRLGVEVRRQVARPIPGEIGDRRAPRLQVGTPVPQHLSRWGTHVPMDRLDLGTPPVQLGTAGVELAERLQVAVQLREALAHLGGVRVEGRPLLGGAPGRGGRHVRSSNGACHRSQGGCQARHGSPAAEEIEADRGDDDRGHDSHGTPRRPQARAQQRAPLAGQLGPAPYGHAPQTRQGHQVAEQQAWPPRRVAAQQEEAAEVDERHGQPVRGPADVAGQCRSDRATELAGRDRGYQDAYQEKPQGRQDEAKGLDVRCAFGPTLSFPSALTHEPESTVCVPALPGRSGTLRAARGHVKL